MKRPKEPKNCSFWLEVAKDEKQVRDFMTRGNPVQKKSLKQAIKILKWERIQERKG
jgi:hypothetical protein